MKADCPLQITYTGKRVKVNAGCITDWLFVPDRLLGERPGVEAVTLFIEAEQAGALVIPEGIIVDCYARDTAEVHDFMLVAYPAVGSGAGVTAGWFDARVLSEVDGARELNDPSVVREALEVMAAKIDTALNGEVTRSPVE